MSSILYYITGHGYGHAVRSNQIIRSLLKALPGVKIDVRTVAPEWLFHDPLSRVSHSRQSVDVGIIQQDSLEMQLGETLQACQALHDRIPQLIEQEIAFLRAHDIRLVLGDIPPLCFEIGARASLPSVAITNFTWNWIYRAYVEAYPAFLPLVEEMDNFYRKATLALTLPYPGDMEIFPRREPIPLIARTSSLDKGEARRRFGLPQSAVVVLLSFGGLGFNRVAWNKLKELSEFFFVATGESSRDDGNVLVLPEAQRRYEDLVRAADVVITKPGYGIVADVISHQVPVLYTDRGEFPEYPLLVKTLSEWATAEFIPQVEVLAGNLAPYLTRLLGKEKNWPAIPLDGANVAAEKILAMMEL